LEYCLEVAVVCLLLIFWMRRIRMGWFEAICATSVFVSQTAQPFHLKFNNNQPIIRLYQSSKNIINRRRDLNKTILIHLSFVQMIFWAVLSVWNLHSQLHCSRCQWPCQLHLIRVILFKIIYLLFLN